MSLARFSSGAQPPLPSKSRKEPNFSPEIFSQKFNVDSENQAPPRPSKMSLNFTDVTLDQKSPNTLSKEEQYFIEALSKTNQLEDPLSLWNKYYKWCKNTFPKDEEKLFNILNDLTKNLSHIEKYKQDPHFVSKWTLYTKYCIDQEEVLKYMEENNIGTQLAMFYKAYCVVNIRKRNFSKANDWILMGKRKGAKPTNKMDEFVKEFEDNMKERLHRDFYGQGKRLSDDDVIEIPALSSQQRNDSNLLDDLDLSRDDYNNPFEIRMGGDMKRKCPFSNQVPKQVVNKRVKLNDLVNSIKMGEFNIYVDQECREAIPESTKLVNEYDALCYKYEFSIAPATPEGKYLSWISQQMPSELSISLDVSNLTNQNSFSIHRDDNPAPGNHLVAQFQLPKRLRKPLKEIKAPAIVAGSFSENPAPVNENERPSPSFPLQPREPLQQQPQPQPVILSQKSSQEINDQYMPLFGSILEEDVVEEDVKRPKTVFNLYKQQAQQPEENLKPTRRITEENTEDGGDEKSHDDSYKFLIALTTGAGKKKDSHNKKVTLPEEGSSEKNHKKKIRKTPHISHKYLAHTPDPEEQEEEEDLERIEQFNKLVQKELPEPKSIKKAQPEPMKELLASPAVSTIRAGNVMRNLDFGGIDVSNEEEDDRNGGYGYGHGYPVQTPRSPLYRDLFGLDQPAPATTSTLPSSYNPGEGTKKVVKKAFRMVKEIPKKELEILKGNRVEVGKRRIIPEIYRKEEPQKEKAELSDFEKYLQGFSNNWKELNTPQKQTESDELSDLLFAAPRSNYFK